MNTAPTSGFDDVAPNDSSFLFEIRKTPPAELKDFTGKLTRFKLPHTEDRKM